MTLRTGKKCEWEDIKIGEVFAWNGCWRIFYKVSKNHLMQIAIDEYDEWAYWLGEKQLACLLNNKYSFYKLPKSVQALWKEEW